MKVHSQLTEIEWTQGHGNGMVLCGWLRARFAATGRQLNTEYCILSKF